MVKDRDVAEDLVGGEDGRDRALARHPEMRESRHLDRAALGFDLAERLLDLRIEEHSLWSALAQDRFLAVPIRAAAGVGEEVEARILHGDRALQKVGESATDLVYAFAIEDQLGEATMDVDRALQPRMLGVDDSLEQRRHQVDEL